MFKIALLIYSLLGIILLPFVLINQIIRIFTGKETIVSTMHRLGFVKGFANSKKTVLIHAASIGESRSAFLMAQTLIDCHFNVILTTVTRTSAKIAKLQFQSNQNFIHAFTPYDIFPFIMLFLYKTKPSKVIFVESEIWPLSIYFSRKITHDNTFLVNARMSARSFRSWSFFAKIGINILKLFAIIFPAQKCDIDKFATFNPNTIYRGNMKNDYIAIKSQLFSQEQFDTKFKPNSLKILIASSHKEEENLILQQISNIPNISIIIAPRHPERSSEVASVIKSFHLNPIEIINLKNKIKLEANDVLLVNQIGHMSICYNVADIVIVCGSFVDNIGGHNPIEAIHHKKPVIIGKYYENCKESVEELSQKSCLQIAWQPEDIENIINNAIQNQEHILDNISKHLNQISSPTNLVLAEIIHSATI